jgi:hypothetical protein
VCALAVPPLSPPFHRYLGMDPEGDSDLLYIAEWALTAPVPDGWTVHLDSEVRGLTGLD